MMKINYSKKFNQLPGIIEQCSNPVYAVFGINNRMVLNVNSDVMKFFKGMVDNCSGDMELNLEFSNPDDSVKVLKYLVNA